MADQVVSMDVRMAVAFFLQAGPNRSVSAFCAENGISRQTYYVFKRRFDAGGLEALVPCSRRPHSSPTATAAEAMAEVIEKRAELIAQGWDAGAVSIRYRLLRAGSQPPSARTIHRILVSHGLIEPQPRKRPRNSFKRFEKSRANECWQMDGKDRPLADGTTVKVLRVQDDCSRQIMASRAAWSENTADSWACIQAAMQHHGAPAMFLTDNGSAFSQRRTRGTLGELEARLRLSGILPITSSISHPQTCGKKEREWQTLDLWLSARPLARSLAELQTQLDAYDLIFNHERPHQAHAGKTPAERFAEVEKATAADTPLAAPLQISNVKVRRNGIIDLGRRMKMSIGTQWAQATVTVLREDPAIAIFHNDELIEFLHIDPDREYQLRTRR
jgi:transposase InsO family protein